MFGFVQKDYFASNLVVTSHLAVGNNVSVYNEFPPARQIISATIDNTTEAASFTPVIESATAKIGDLVIVLIEISAPFFANEATINIPANAYVTFAGVPTNSISVTGYQFFGLLLMFDGEKFIQTTENC